MPSTSFQAVQKFVQAYNRAWSSALSDLLQTKHLYQKVQVDVPQVVSEHRRSLPHADALLYDKQVQGIVKTHPFPSTGEWTGPDGGPSITPLLIIRNVKLRCQHCKSSEVFSPQLTVDVTNDLASPSNRTGSISLSSIQSFLYLLVLQCQRCQTDPEGFLIRKKGGMLILEGRSPIEEVVTPSYLPKKEAPLYSDALVASHAGKGLAALFYLRCFIEQFARRQLSIYGRITGDELLDKYSGLLPDSLRSEFPSLRSLYERLSVPVHSATADDTLFEEVRLQVDRHFDMRRLFNVDDLNP